MQYVLLRTSDELADANQAWDIYQLMLERLDMERVQNLIKQASTITLMVGLSREN